MAVSEMEEIEFEQRLEPVVSNSKLSGRTTENGSRENEMMRLAAAFNKYKNDAAADGYLLEEVQRKMWELWVESKENGAQRRKIKKLRREVGEFKKKFARLKGRQTNNCSLRLKFKRNLYMGRCQALQKEVERLKEICVAQEKSLNETLAENRGYKEMLANQPVASSAYGNIVLHLQCSGLDGTAFGENPVNLVLTTDNAPPGSVATEVVSDSCNVEEVVGESQDANANSVPPVEVTSSTDSGPLAHDTTYDQSSFPDNLMYTIQESDLVGVTSSPDLSTAVEVISSNEIPTSEALENAVIQVSKEQSEPGAVVVIKKMLWSLDHSSYVTQTTVTCDNAGSVEETVGKTTRDNTSITEDGHNRKSGRCVLARTYGKPHKCPVSQCCQTVKKRLKCTVEGCSKYFSHKRNLMIHVGLHDPKRYETRFQCTIDGCDRNFLTTGGLRKHIFGHTGQKPFVCPVEECGKSFSLKESLKRHVGGHAAVKPLNCSYEGCNKSFGTEYKLRSHEKYHTLKESFECPFEGCGRVFAQKANMNRHTLLHTGEKPFKCPVEGCDKGFTDKNGMNIHFYDVHADEKPFKCNVDGCGKQFPRMFKLKEHMRIHNGDTLGCAFNGCTKRFATKSGLRKHALTHAAVKPFWCTYPGCDRRYSRKERLNNHMLMHEPAKVLECPYDECYKHYVDKVSYERHIRTHCK